MEIINFPKVDKFIRNQDKAISPRILRMVTLLQIYTYNLGMPHYKRICKNIYELRIRGNPEIRFFYTFKNNKIYIFHFIIKKTMKIPINELKNIKRLYKEIDKYSIYVINTL